MSLDIWFRDDIRNTLVALNEANSTALLQLAAQLDDLQNVKHYRDGYRDALRAVAVAFGIAIPTQMPDPLTDRLRLTRTWKEVIDDEDVNGA